ncbi:CHAT domain-containing protein [Penicillium herquei]|nr:CHAT domain-containing protein [Penicillium herquei]
METPEHSVLPHARNEVDEVINVLIDCTTVLQCTSRERVFCALKTCQIFHLAGHGWANSTNPLEGTLLLDDWESAPLTVASLIDIMLSASADTLPFIAYLSGCGTGRTGGKSSMDGSIQIPNACQPAGFRHVIGTLWDVNDELCVDMARLVYQNLRADGHVKDHSVSLALNNASRFLRDKWRKEADRTRTCHEALGHEEVPGRYAYMTDQPATAKMPLWIPYVHFGV